MTDIILGLARILGISHYVWSMCTNNTDPSKYCLRRLNISFYLVMFPMQFNIQVSLNKLLFLFLEGVRAFLLRSSQGISGQPQS